MDNRLKTTEGCPKGFNPAEFATQTCFLGRYGPELGSDEFGGIIFIFAVVKFMLSSCYKHVQIGLVALKRPC